MIAIGDTVTVHGSTFRNCSSDGKHMDISSSEGYKKYFGQLGTVIHEAGMSGAQDSYGFYRIRVHGQAYPLVLCSCEFSPQLQDLELLL